jgi:hypothetical protein
MDQSIYHVGVLNVYMSKVANAATADGSSGWFKIYQISATTDGGSSIKFATDGEYKLLKSQTWIFAPSKLDTDVPARCQPVCFQDTQLHPSRAISPP